MKRICRGCGAQQAHRLIRCDACGKPLVFPESFVCPVCKAESFNLHDIIEGYCGRCHAWTVNKTPGQPVSTGAD